MIKGDLVVTNNLESLPIYGATHKIVMLAEDANLAARYNAVLGTILLPPYEAVCAEMDNNLEAFYGYYYAHLNGFEASRFIGAILKALYDGVNICIYIPRDSADLRFNSALLEYFMNTFGIVIGIDQPAYMLDQVGGAMMNILSILYMNNYISIQELFGEYPPRLPIAESILPKLIQEFNAPIFNDINEYARYFFEYKENVKKNNNLFLEPGIVFGV